jgi:hypothetical protein
MRAADPTLGRPVAGRSRVPGVEMITSSPLGFPVDKVGKHKSISA